MALNTNHTTDTLSPCSGAVTVAGNLAAANLSGTNTGDQTLASLLPEQAGNAGKVLVTDGETVSWRVVPTQGAQTVTVILVPAAP